MKQILITLAALIVFPSVAAACPPEFARFFAVREYYSAPIIQRQVIRERVVVPPPVIEKQVIRQRQRSFFFFPAPRAEFRSVERFRSY